jgi:hypothetical protein
MGVLDDFEAGAACHRDRVSLDERQAAEVADALAMRRKDAAELTPLLEQFRLAAHGTANVTAQVEGQNWRGKNTYKPIRGWQISGEAHLVTYLLLDVDGGVWAVHKTVKYRGRPDWYTGAQRREEHATARPWRLGESTGQDGIACEASIARCLGGLVNKLGITL